AERGVAAVLGKTLRRNSHRAAIAEKSALRPVIERAAFDRKIFDVVYCDAVERDASAIERKVANGAAAIAAGVRGNKAVDRRSPLKRGLFSAVPFDNNAIGESVEGARDLVGPGGEIDDRTLTGARSCRECLIDRSCAISVAGRVRSKL